MAMVKHPVAFTAIVLSVTTSQGGAYEVDKRHNLYKSAIRAMGLDEFDSESDDDHTLPASPGFGYLGNSGAGNIQEINVAGDNVEDFSDIQEVIELVGVEVTELSTNKQHSLSHSTNRDSGDPAS